MGKNILDTTFEEQLIKYGYFPEQLPPCFSSSTFFKHYKSLLSVDSQSYSECTEYSLSKKKGRRVLRIPNPEHQIRLIDYILQNSFKLIILCSNTSHSQSNPFKTGSSPYTCGILDIPRLRDTFRVRSAFLNNLHYRIKYCLGYKYIYRIDLSSFYDSIYTHALEWATKGREQAKLELNGYAKVNKSDIGYNLDLLVRKTNSRETSGIPTGPYTSRILSEILLVAVDKKLEELGLKFLRYVDDYEFYFKSEDELYRMQGQISNVFSSYRLHINEHKTKISVYPYHSTENLNVIFGTHYRHCKKASTKNKRIDALMFMFFKADSLFQAGEVGVYKYLLKFLKDGDFSDVWDIMESFLVNIILIKPELAEHVFPIVTNHLEYITDSFKNGLRDNLISSVQNSYHNEAQWLFWILRKVCYQFNVNELHELLTESDDDILRILIIDYIAEYKPKSAKLNNDISDLYTKYANYNFRSEHWLLIYTCYEQKWFDFEVFKSAIESNNFASAMLNKKVTFFLSPSCDSDNAKK